MYHLPFHHVKVFLTQEQQQYYGMIEERETSLKKQTMSGPWATPLNPKTRNTFEYVMWAILISLKYRKWQHELNWWMAIINSLPKSVLEWCMSFLEKEVLLIRIPFPYYNVGDPNLSLDL